MKYLVLVSHGSLAAGLKSSVAMFAKDKAKQIITASLAEDMTVTQFATEFKQTINALDDVSGLVVLADIVGGSPLTTACNVLAELGLLDQSIVLGGMNLTMALTAVVLKDEFDGELLAETIRAEAATAIQKFAVNALETDEEEI